MPSTPQINLDVRNFSSSDPGWANVQGSNGQPYSYSFSGGDDGLGGLVQTVGKGRDTAPLQLTADPRYQISGCTFSNDTQGQLSWSGSSPRAGSIIDANDRVETAKYTVTVTDTTANCTVPCDPSVRNVPQ